MANPKAWLPFFGETKGKRAAFVGAGLVASLAIHFALPYTGMLHSTEAVSDGPIVVEFISPPLPLPPSDELNPTPNEEDVDAPVLDDEPVQMPEDADAPEEVPDAVEEPDAPTDAPVDVPLDEPTDVPVVDDGTKTPDQLQAERDERRRQRYEERRRRFEERRRKRRGSGGKQGGAPDSGDWKQGTPDSVYACTATERGEELRVHKERPLDEWVGIVPTVLSGFRTRPDLGDYLDSMSHIVSREKKSLRRLGFGEVALDNHVLQLELDDPAGTRLAVGRLDARCLVGFKYTANLFPMTLVRAPVRIVEGTRASSHLVDFVLYKDVSFEMRSVDGTVLPFTKGRLKNGKAIAQNVEDHFQAARLAKSFAEALGISWGPRSASTTPGKKSSGAGTALMKEHGSQVGKTGQATDVIAPALAASKKKKKVAD